MVMMGTFFAAGYVGMSYLSEDPMHVCLILSSQLCLINLVYFGSSSLPSNAMKCFEIHLMLLIDSLSLSLVDGRSLRRRDSVNP